MRLEKGYLRYYWISDANIWMSGGIGGDISDRKSIFIHFLFFEQVVNVKKRLSYCPALIIH